MPNEERRKTQNLAQKLLILLGLFFIQPCNADEAPWYSDFFVETSVQRYFAPGIFKDLVSPDFGFRVALGYEFKRFRFALETGYSHIDGTNPLVLDIKLSPLALKAGYALPIRWGLGIQADLGFGLMFSKTIHYETAIDMLMDNKTNSRTRTLFMGARFYATYTIPGNFLKLYAGGGLDLLFETGGLIPMPLVEFGVSFKPLMLIHRKPAGQKAEIPAPVFIDKPAETSQSETEPPIPALIFVRPPENITAQESKEGRIAGLVYFEADTAVLMDRYWPVLDDIGLRLAADLSLRITLRGYSAPFGTPEGRIAISGSRANFCRDYLVQKFGIASDRIRIEYYGAERKPRFIDSTPESYRCVELIIE